MLLELGSPLQYLPQAVQDTVRVADANGSQVRFLWGYCICSLSYAGQLLNVCTLDRTAYREQMALQVLAKGPKQQAILFCMLLVSFALQNKSWVGSVV